MMHGKSSTGVQALETFKLASCQKHRRKTCRRRGRHMSQSVEDVHVCVEKSGYAAYAFFLFCLFFLS